MRSVWHNTADFAYATLKVFPHFWFVIGFVLLILNQLINAFLAVEISKDAISSRRLEMTLGWSIITERRWQMS